MKKIKWTFMTLAISLAIGGAFATRLPQDCQAATQYYFNGGYVLAGRLGVDYICVMPTAQVCTYYKVGGVYTPCMNGSYCTANCRTSNPSPQKPKN